MSHGRHACRWFALLALACVAAQAAEHPPRGARGPAASLSLILGRPTDHSIALSVLSAADIEARLEYGEAPGTYTERTEPRTAKAGVPVEFELGSLKPNTRCSYRRLTRPPGRGDFRPEPEATFQTQRPPGSTFVFAVQGDSHPEREGKMHDPALDTQTMHNAAKEPLDFHFLMGDDFSIDRQISSQTLSPSVVDQIHAHQRSFLGLAGRSAALFLVNGNHEHADRCLLNGTENCAPVRATSCRTRAICG